MRYLKAMGVGALAVGFVGIGWYAIDSVFGHPSEQWLNGWSIYLAWVTGGLGWLWGHDK